MAQWSLNITFENCVFGCDFLKEASFPHSQVKTVTFIGPQIEMKDIANFVKSILIRLKTVETFECAHISSEALQLLSENEISQVFSIGKLLRSGKNLYPQLSS